MLSILDQGTRLCDGVDRREWLRIGGLGLGGISLPGLLRSQQAAAAGNGSGQALGKAKSVILFWLTGGPPQQESWDPKPNAPKELRGPFLPIASKTPGMDVCELMPRTAQLTDKIAVLRAVVSGDNAHSSSGYQMLTGVPHQPLNRESALATAPNLWPSVGGILRTLKSDSTGLPPAIVVPEHIWNDGNKPWPGQDAGFLGRQYDPWLVHCDPSQQEFKIPDLALPEDVSQLRFDRRRSLLTQINSRLDDLNRDPKVAQYDQETQQAIGLLSASKSRQAFDVSQEPESVRDRYGRSRYAQSVLLARRLIEAGVSLVRINWTRIKDKPNQGGWDTHSKNAESLKTLLMPMMDQAYSALLEDLDQRGLLDDTLVVWVGEFGRTPKINRNAGRDHWGNVFSLALAGGGIRGGTVHGSSDRDAAYPVDGRVRPKDFNATIFHCLGYHPDTLIYDNLNRPMPISRGEVIQQVF